MESIYIFGRKIRLKEQKTTNKQAFQLILTIYFNKKMNKLFNFLSLSLIFVFAFTFTEVSAGTGTLLTVVNPNNWGIDNTIAGVVAALGAYLVGLLTKKREKRKRKKNDLSNI